MNNRISFLLIIFLFFSCLLKGQDLNQTNTRYSPLYLNPALTGNFPGNMRLGASYRDQGTQLMGKGYKTWNLYMDTPISISLRKYDWVGFGVQVYDDKAGSLPLSTLGIILNAGYHFAFDRKYKNVFSIGIQYGNLQRKVDSKDIVLESDHIDPGVPSVDRPGLTDYKDNFSDINFGINFKAKFSKTNLFNIGIAVYHILESEYKGIRHNNYINRRFTLHSSLEYTINKRFKIKPQLIASISKNAYNIMPQFKSFFKLSKYKNNDDMIYMGLGYRIKDALQIIFGIRYKKIDFGIAYDITVSSAAQYNNGRGGLEIGIFRIFNYPRRIKTIPVILCPEL